MPFLRNPYFWSPVYIFLLVWMVRNKGKHGLIWCVFLLAVLACTDFTAASIIKPWIHRLRPCHSTHLGFQIRPLVHCGSGYSFPSAHAANHVAISLFLIFTGIVRKNWLKMLLIFWAAIVCYAQMYVVVHYPSDIAAGCLLGILFSSLWSMLYTKRYPEQTEASMH
jgi:undecaprenyl-diphosphatase